MSGCKVWIGLWPARVLVITLFLSLALSGCATAQAIYSKSLGLLGISRPDSSMTTNTQPIENNQPIVNNQPTATSSAPIDGPLSVVIESPADDITVTESPLEISGQADPGTVISINDEILLVQEDRRFSVQITLVEGINLIEIIASDLDENQEAFYLTVELELQP
jgi:hypothetical protein